MSFDFPSVRDAEDNEQKLEVARSSYSMDRHSNPVSKWHSNLHSSSVGTVTSLPALPGIVQPEMGIFQRTVLVTEKIRVLCKPWNCK